MIVKKNSSKNSFKEFILDQLEPLGSVNGRSMFGGFGMYRGETFFGIVFKGRLYFNNDSSTVSSYTGKETKPFRPSQKQTLKFYYEVPVEILEDEGQLVEWARKAVATGQRPPA